MISLILLVHNLWDSMGSSGVLSHITSITSGTFPSCKSLYQKSNLTAMHRWLPFDPSRNWPDLGTRFIKGEKALRDAQKLAKAQTLAEERAAVNTEILEDPNDPVDAGVSERDDMDDEVDLSWSTVLKRTFEAFLREERPNMYGEELNYTA